MNKEDLRKYVKKRLASLPEERKMAISRNLSSKVLDCLNLLNSKSPQMSSDYIGCFAPMMDEFWCFLRYEEFKQGPALPCVENHEKMSFRACEWEQVFAGYRQCKLDESAPLVRPGLALIPGLAFTREGKRLGRGAGHYDRYLASHDLLKIGVCWEEQVFEEMKTESHDILMDIVVTDKNIYIRGNKI